MNKLLPMLKRYRRHLIWAVILLPLLLAFNYYTVIPICMKYSKPVTMYMEWGEKAVAQGTPKRITFRIPSAYLLPNINPELRSGGKVRFLAVQINEHSAPGCLYFSQTAHEIQEHRSYLSYIHLTPSGVANRPNKMQRSICTKNPKIPSDVEGFDVYKSDRGKCYVPQVATGFPLFFDCMITDMPRGCRAWAFYKDMRLQYGFPHANLTDWRTINDRVVAKIDDLITDIDE